MATPAILGLALSLLAQSPVNPGATGAPTVEVQPLAVHQAIADRIENADQRALQGRVLPNLVEIDGLRVQFYAPGIDAVRDLYEGPARLDVTGTLRHPFDSSVRDITIRLILVKPGDATKIWRRLTASPLELSDVDLRKQLPRPWITWSKSAIRENVVAPREEFEVERSTRYGELPLDKRSLPQFILTLDGYKLEDPSAEDIEAIVNNGGVHDLTALALWAEESNLDHAKFAPETVRHLMRVVGNRLQSMRAPPGYGDLIRLHALFLMVRMLAMPENLEFLLSLERPMEILLNAAGLSYHDAVDDENRLELPVHNVRQLPSLLEFMDAYKIALQDIRRESFPRLLELAFDPLDFRNSPARSQFRRSKVQQQARSLLEPFTPTSVSGIIRALDGNLDAQREVWQFYIRVHHTPALVPMMAWLQEHPYELESVGFSAARELGASTVPILLRYYLDPVELVQRELSRAMLLQLNDQAAQNVVSAIRSVGVVLRNNASIEHALDSFERRERHERKIQAALLEEQAFGMGKAQSSVSARLRALNRLGELDPERLRRRSAEVIKFLSSAALRLDAERPVESARALDMLESLPLGDAQLEALDALAIVRARIQQSRDEDQAALDILLDHDPDLRVHSVRKMYADIVHDWMRLCILLGRFGKAHDLLQDATRRVPLDPRFDGLRKDLFLAQYWPALILGGLFSLSFTGTSIWGAIRGYRHLRARWPEFRRRRRRLRQRKKHAKATDKERQRLAREARLERAAQSDATFDPSHTDIGHEDHASSPGADSDTEYSATSMDDPAARLDHGEHDEHGFADDEELDEPIGSEESEAGTTQRGSETPARAGDDFGDDVLDDELDDEELDDDELEDEELDDDELEDPESDRRDTGDDSDPNRSETPPDQADLDDPFADAELEDDELGDDELGDDELGDDELGDDELGDDELGDDEPGSGEPGDDELDDDELDDDELDHDELGDYEPGDGERRSSGLTQDSDGSSREPEIRTQRSAESRAARDPETTAAPPETADDLEVSDEELENFEPASSTPSSGEPVTDAGEAASANIDTERDDELSDDELAEFDALDAAQVPDGTEPTPSVAGSSATEQDAAIDEAFDQAFDVGPNSNSNDLPNADPEPRVPGTTHEDASDELDDFDEAFDAAFADPPGELEAS